jgi:hypothetical protein
MDSFAHSGFTAADIKLRHYPCVQIMAEWDPQKVS